MISGGVSRRAAEAKAQGKVESKETSFLLKKIMEPHNDKPPLFSTWSTWYIMVILFLLVLIFLFYRFTKTFS